MLTLLTRLMKTEPADLKTVAKMIGTVNASPLFDKPARTLKVESMIHGIAGGVLVRLVEVDAGNKHPNMDGKAFALLAKSQVHNG